MSRFVAIALVALCSTYLFVNADPFLALTLTAFAIRGAWALKLSRVIGFFTPYRTAWALIFSLIYQMMAHGNPVVGLMVLCCALKFNWDGALKRKTMAPANVAFKVAA